jgi:hypothetical protein
MEYQKFIELLKKSINIGPNFYEDLLINIIKNPQRYSGLFRNSNFKTKLLQNVTQSQEIKFGDFFEEVVTQYISELGYVNQQKNLGRDQYGDNLNADQLFKDNTYLNFVEQKIRDDHDSTKKRGQFLNFIKKVDLLVSRYPGLPIKASMWFVDDALQKNKNYYLEEITKIQIRNVQANLYYGGSFFDSLNNGSSKWNQIISHLKMMRKESSNESLFIPDFDTSDQGFDALKKLSQNYISKLLSDDEKYVLLRSEIFPTGHNINRYLKEVLKKE